MKNKGKIVICILVSVFVVSLISYIYYLAWGYSHIPFRCPESYATNDEYNVALRDYIQTEISRNHNMTAEVLLKNRYAKLIDNHCTETLQTLQDNLSLGSTTSSTDIIQMELDDYLRYEMLSSTIQE